MIRFVAIPTEQARAYQAGAPDAYGNPPEKTRADGEGQPCRHCLRPVPAGAEALVLAYRPFGALQPYAETGPIFLCADGCAQGGGEGLPDILTSSPDYLVKGYGDDDRIVYGTGAIVPPQDMQDKVAEVFSRPDIAYVHVRSARNNCYLARIDRSAG